MQHEPLPAVSLQGRRELPAAAWPAALRRMLTLMLSMPTCRLPKECQSPTEWFIADDPATHTRYFVIQVGRQGMVRWGEQG